MPSAEKFKLFAGNANPHLAEEMAAHLGIPLSKSRVTKFRDGEIRVQIEETVRGCNVFILQPTCSPVNDNLMELLVMIDAFKRASAKTINAVIPYYGYARQERKSKPRDPISAKLVANLITAAGADRVVCMDLHAGAIQGFFDIPMDHLSTIPLMADYYKKKRESGEIKGDIVVVSPDIGGVSRARDLADRLNCGIVIIDKRRPEPNHSEIMNIIGKVKGRVAIIPDDIIDTGGTITQGATAIKEQGAKEVHICCSHALFSNDAVKKLTESCVKEIVISNTIPPKEDVFKSEKIKVLSVGPLLGEAIRSIHYNLSVSRLFD